MKLFLRRDLGGFALAALQEAHLNGTSLDEPFVLFTGPNGSGKSAVLRGIRASLGLRGERMGRLDTPFCSHLDPKGCEDIERLATHVQRYGDDEIHDDVPAVFSLRDLGWAGQPSYLFDSRAASGLANQASLSDDDMLHHASLIAGGGAKVSHGQFVAQSWQEALHWATGFHDIDEPWERQRPSPARAAVRSAALAGKPPSTERWLFIDEPETAIDAEALLLGLSLLLKVAEIGRLRVFCASHSLLFAAGLGKHPKVQVVDLGPQRAWMQTQSLTLRLACDLEKLEDIGTDMLARHEAAAKTSNRGSRRR